MSLSPAIIGWRAYLQVYMPALTCTTTIKGRTLGVRCLASKSRGFGAEPAKNKSSNSKISKESIRITSEPSKLVSGAPKKRTQKAPELTAGVDRKSSNPVLDREFLEKVEAVRRSARELKKADEEKIYQAIDYDSPLEPTESTIGLGAKVGVGIAVVVFGLVFALGDFTPPTSVGSDDSAIVEKQLTDKEKAILKGRLQQYEEALNNSPEDPTALEGAAVTLAELGEYERASSLLEKLTKERPNDNEAYRLLGEVKYELKDFEGSASAYRSSLSAVQVLLSSREKLNDGGPDASDILTDANGKLEEKTEKVDPVQVELLLGKAYSDWGHVGDAVAVYDQLISKYPNDFRGYLAKGIILKENGKFGDAERMFIQAKFFAPEKAKALVDRYSRQ